jgi:hypothetical protein
MKINYNVTLKGFICIPRSIIPDLIKELGISGFAKYIVLVTQADFDKKHKHYSKIIRDDKEIAKEFNSSSSTFYKSRKILTKKGFLVSEAGVSQIPSMEAFDSKMLTSLTKKDIQITIAMLKDWTLLVEEHNKYVDNLNDKWVQNGS